jgi:hypothetical protein
MAGFFEQFVAFGTDIGMRPHLTSFMPPDIEIHHHRDPDSQTLIGT